MPNSNNRKANMKTRYLWQVHGLTFKTLKAARAWCQKYHDGLSIISRIKATP